MAQLDDMLVEAAMKGSTAQVELLLALGANPKAWESGALRSAATYGHTDCVRILIPISDPKAYESRALRLAAQYGHKDCVRLLIPVSDHYEEALDATSDPGCRKLLEEAINDAAR